MQQLLGDKAGTTDASFLRELFLQRLPPNVRMVLASSDTADLEKLAQLADKIVEVAIPPIQSVATTYPPTTEFDQLRQEISDLKHIVEGLHLHHRRQRRSSSRAPTPRSSRASTPTTNSDSMCWYHHRFGDQARKCQQPCSQSSSGNTQASH